MSRFLETLKEVSRSQLLPAAIPENGPANGRKTGGLDGFLLMDLPEVDLPEVNLPGVDLAGVDLAGVDLPEVDLPEVAEPAMPAGTPRVELRREEFPPLAPPQQDGVAVTAVQLNVDRRTPLMPHTFDTSIVEQYRKLRTKIQQQHAIQPIRSLLVASPGPGEGKTVTVMNLALSFAMLPDFKVLVIDGDLRKGTVAKWLGTKRLPGLSNLIDGSAKPENVILKSEDFPLYVMESGTSERPAAELLTSPRLQETILRMSQHFDLVLVDSPPVNLITDAQMLASSCDAVLLVARAFSTTSKAFQKTLNELEHCRLVGTILNGGMRAHSYKRYDGY